MKLTSILVFTGLAGWFFLGVGLSYRMPDLEIHRVTALPMDGDRSAPFFEIMSPVPQRKDQVWLPHLIYRKGPPERFLDQIELFTSSNHQKERITFYGRRTYSDLTTRVLGFFGYENASKDALGFYACERSSISSCAQPGWLLKFALRPILLSKAHELLHDAKAIYLMDQSSHNAFLLKYGKGDKNRNQYTALFFRRSSSFRIDYVADNEFRIIDPVLLFRKSFLVDKRSDALEYLAKNLSAIHMDQGTESLEPNSIWWPLSLLAANFSVNPNSVDTLFHFSGLNALIYKQKSFLPWFDIEVDDLLRGNIFSAEKYAGDISPNSPRTADIERLARSLSKFIEDKP